MLFNSIGFLLFLPIVFLFYWFVFKPLRLQNLLVVVASYVFYAFWDVRFLLLIAVTTLSSYVSGILIDKLEGNRGQQRLVSTANIILNVGILCVFKYYNFFAENFDVVMRCFGIHIDAITLNIVLPVGISFYTFQALSYSIDVYQRKSPVCKDIVAFFAYISFFPQLVAGPIERSTNLLPQFCRERTFDYAQAVDGCRQMLWGFFKKVVVADTCATQVNMVFSEYESLHGFTLLAGGILFAFQIYGDFSGYSDIAIGTARLFGISLRRNFNYPYFSRDIAEFWRRWHISLTTWFRDYVYIPMGGSRCSVWKVMRNTLVIYLVSGFWHGANWTFIVWGVYNAVLFFPLLLLKKNRRYTDAVKGVLPSPKEALQIVATFLLVTLGWIVFRAENMRQACSYINRMVCDLRPCMPECGRRAFLFVLVLLVVEWIQREKPHALQIGGGSAIGGKVFRWSVYLLILLSIVLFAGSQSDFIYFQF